MCKDGPTHDDSEEDSDVEGSELEYRGRDDEALAPVLLKNSQIHSGPNWRGQPIEYSDFLRVFSVDGTVVLKHC